MSWTASLPFKGHFCHPTDVFKSIIGNRVRPLSVHYFHIQRLQAHYSVQSVSVPHHWWIWRGFWRPYSYHGLTPSYIICWELCPCFQWLWFTFPNQCHKSSTDWATAHWNAVISASIHLNKKNSSPYWTKALEPTLTVLPAPTLVIEFCWLSIETTQFYLRGTSCTCCAKFTLRIDHNTFSWSVELEITSTLAILLFLPTR